MTRSGLLIVLSGDSPGGIERFVANVIPILKEKNIKFEILCSKSIGGYYFRHFKANSEKLLGPLKPSKFGVIGMTSQYYKIFKDSEFNTVLSFDYWRASEQAMASFLTKKKLFVSFRNTIPVNKTRAYLRSIISNAFSSGFIANSASVYDYMLRSLFLKKGKLFQFDNGINLDFYQLNTLNQKNTHKLKIGTVARLDPVKDHFKIIEIAKLAKFNNKQWEFIWAGEGKLLSEYERIIDENKLKSFIKILGFVDSTKGLYSQFDVFLLTSKNEGLSQALLEACASGLPVVASNVPGIKDVVMNKINGILVQQDDINGYFNAIQDLENNIHLRRELGKEGHRIVNDKYSIKKVFAKYLKTMGLIDGN
ncbi:MAG: glycosyltransferase [Ignavibacteriales bacterium]|nr:glycosyltransferase [Ignavibacteriales bacterium]